MLRLLLLLLLERLLVGVRRVCKAVVLPKGEGKGGLLLLLLLLGHLLMELRGSHCG